MVTFHQSSWIRQKPQGEQSDGIKTQSVPTALPAVFAFLKNNAKYHKCFQGGSVKILIIWRVQAYHSDKKAHPGTGHSFRSYRLTWCLPSQDKYDFSLPNPGSLYAPGFMVFPSVWQGGDEGEGSAGDWVLYYLMLGTAVNNLREQICILIYIWFRINLEFVVFHQHTPTSEKGKSLLILKPESRCSARD